MRKSFNRDSPTGMQALSELCQEYWYPLYAFARHQGNSREDSQDLTQGFFIRLLKKDYLKNVDPLRGRFRNYLLSAFKRFIINEWEKARTAKHGAKHCTVSWDEIEAEQRYSQEPSHNLTPEKLYDQQWALTIVESTMADLRRFYVRTKNKAVFEALQVFLTGVEPSETYKVVAARLNLTEDAVKMRVHRMKLEFGHMIRARIAETVSDEKELEDEMRYLFSAWT